VDVVDLIDLMDEVGLMDEVSWARSWGGRARLFAQRRRLGRRPAPHQEL